MSTAKKFEDKVDMNRDPITGSPDRIRSAPASARLVVAQPA